MTYAGGVGGELSVGSSLGNCLRRWHIQVLADLVKPQDELINQFAHGQKHQQNQSDHVDTVSLTRTPRLDLILTSVLSSMRWK